MSPLSQPFVCICTRASCFGLCVTSSYCFKCIKSRTSWQCWHRLLSLMKNLHPFYSNSMYTKNIEVFSEVTSPRSVVMFTASYQLLLELILSWLSSYLIDGPGPSWVLRQVCVVCVSCCSPGLFRLLLLCNVGPAHWLSSDLVLTDHWSQSLFPSDGCLWATPGLNHFLYSSLEK